MSPRAACRLAALGFTQVYDYVGGIADWKASGLALDGVEDPELHVADATRTDVPTCAPDEHFDVAGPRTDEAGWDVCAVVDCDGMVVGRLRPTKAHTENGPLVEDVMEPGPVTVRPDGLLQPLVERMERRETPHVLVTSAQGVLMGALLLVEARRLLSGEPAEQIWRDCDGCPGRWAKVTP